MAIIDLYSKRQREQRGELSDVYTYDSIPHALRVQIVHIWDDALGNDGEYSNSSYGVRRTYKALVDILCREYGVFRLYGSSPHGRRNYRDELQEFLLNETDYEKVLDVIELSFHGIELFVNEFEYKYDRNYENAASAAIKELNGRLKEHAVGYEYANGKILKVDSQLIHHEVVKPALTLLNRDFLAGAQQEFLASHEHYRAGKYKEALNEALKSFESTMKAICDKRNWPYDPNDTSKKLIEICFNNGLIPQFWQQKMTSIRVLLESSVPTGRNKLSGHGQGSAPVTVPSYIVAYVLHMAAAAILFLSEAENELI
jgi:hypothetical protein